MVGKVIKRKSDRLYVKWKGYDNSFNSWVNKLIDNKNKLAKVKSELDLCN